MTAQVTSAPSSSTGDHGAGGFSRLGPLGEPLGTHFLVAISHSGFQKAGIVDFLYQEFGRHHPRLKGKVFCDEYSLKKGCKAYERMHSAFQDAFVAVVVLSKEFLDSRDPMDELHMLLQRQRTNQETKAVILPVFYELGLNDVKRRAADDLAAAASSSSTQVDRDMKLRSGNDLHDLCATSGYVGFEVGGKQKKKSTEIVQAILQRTAQILVQLGLQLVQTLPATRIGLDTNNPESQLFTLLELVSAAAPAGSKPRAVLLHGMAGTGKTLLVKAAWNALQRAGMDVPACFLELQLGWQDNPDGCEAELRKLQGQVLQQLLLFEEEGSLPKDTATGRAWLKAHLTGEQVLLVVDGVWADQLRKLLPDDLMDVLAPGSVVLVTSRGPRAASTVFRGAVVAHEMQFLNEAQSLELFCRHAFDSAAVPASFCDEHPELARQVVAQCGGLPSALVAAGEHIAAERSNWPRGPPQVHDLLSAAYSLPGGVFTRMRASWQALTPEEQLGLMDIVWFLNLEGRGWVEDYCKQSCLAKLEQVGMLECGNTVDAVVSVHPVVRHFCRMDACLAPHRQRLMELRVEGELELLSDEGWDEDDICCSLLDSEDVEAAEGLLLQGYQLNASSCDALRSNKCLRIIQMDQNQCQQALSLASPSLRWMRCNHDAIPESINLDLRLQKGQGSASWTVVALQSLQQLQQFTVTGSPVKTSEDRELKRLRVADCPKLKTVALRGVRQLGLVEVADCPSLEAISGMGRLQQLTLVCCNAAVVSSSFRTLKNLTSLVLETPLPALPDTLASLSSLATLTLRSCGNIRALPACLASLPQLTQLTVHHCYRLELLAPPPSLQHLCILGCGALLAVRSLAVPVGSSTAVQWPAGAGTGAGPADVVQGLLQLKYAEISSCPGLLARPCPCHLPPDLEYVFDSQPCPEWGQQAGGSGACCCTATVTAAVAGAAVLVAATAAAAGPTAAVAAPAAAVATGQGLAAAGDGGDLDADMTDADVAAEGRRLQALVW